MHEETECLELVGLPYVFVLYPIPEANEVNERIWGFVNE